MPELRGVDLIHGFSMLNEWMRHWVILDLMNQKAGER